jgi:predicted small lipoprotein YifL
MRSLPILFAALCLAACGQSGALYLPDEKSAAAAAPPAAPAPGPAASAQEQDEKEAGAGGTSPNLPATQTAPAP